MPNETITTAVASGISAAGGVGLLAWFIRSWFNGLAAQLDVLSKKVSTLQQGFAKLQADLIPEGRERVTKLEAHSTLPPRRRVDRA